MNFQGVNYTKQRRQYDCVPTAIANALKHYGKKFSYRKHLDFLHEVLNTQEDGTKSKTFNTLPEYNFGVFKVATIRENAKFGTVSGYLESNAVIANLSDNGQEWHTVFLFKRDGVIYGANFFRNEAISVVSPNKLQKLFFNNHYNSVAFLAKNC